MLPDPQVRRRRLRVAGTAPVAAAPGPGEDETAWIVCVFEDGKLSLLLYPVKHAASATRAVQGYTRSSNQGPIVGQWRLGCGRVRRPRPARSGGGVSVVREE